MARFVLEGTWTGYTSSQSRVVHREAITSARRAERLKRLHKIVYSDGTALLINVRELEYRETVGLLINSYRELIRDAERHGGSVVRVDDLIEKPAASPTPAELAGAR